MQFVATGRARMDPFVDAGMGDDPASLIARIATSRDKAALSSLFQIYAPRLKSMMLKLGADGALAEDLVQETLLSVWRKAHLYNRDRGAVSTWIFTIARNLRIDQVRRQSNQPYQDLESIELASDAPSGISLAEQHQIVQRVGKALGLLPPDQREVVRLSFVEEMAHAEISGHLGIPLGTVKSRLRLAYERLRPMLEDLQ